MFWLLRGSLFVLAIVAAQGCALPPPSTEMGEEFREGFLHRDSLAIATVADRGLAEYRAGRLIAGEMAVEQAYLSTSKELRRPLMHNLAIVYARSGAYDESLALYDRLRSEVPESLNLMVEEANVTVASRRYDAALSLYDHAFTLGLKENELGLAATIARIQSAVYYHTGRFAEARCSSNVAFGLNGGVDELVQHSRLLVAIGRYREALDVIGAKFSPPQYGANTRILHTAALALFGLQKQSEAIVLVEGALEIGFDDKIEENGMLLVLMAVAPQHSLVLELSEEERARIIDEVLTYVLKEPIPIELMQGLNDLATASGQ